MGEEESSVKDDDDDVPAIESSAATVDDGNKTSTASLTKPANKPSGPSQQPLQCHSTPGSYASNLYALNNVPSNTGTIHFTPNNNSTPAHGQDRFLRLIFLSSIVDLTLRHTLTCHLPSSAPRYPLPVTTTTTLYMTSTAPFVSAPSSSSTGSVSSSYHYAAQQHPQMTAANNWYHYPQQQQTPYRAQQYGHPQ